MSTRYHGQVGDADVEGNQATSGALRNYQVMTRGIRDATGPLVLLALFAYGLWSRGGFYRSASHAMVVVALLLLAANLFLAHSERALSPVEISVLALAVWWFFTAFLHHDEGAFFPFGASLLCFVTASNTLRLCQEQWRHHIQNALVVLGALSAASGVVACCLRIRPFALPAQQLWRLSSSLTYANAAGLLLAMVCLLALGCSLKPAVSAPLIAVMMCGLIASQSRAAVLAFGVVALWKLRRQLRRRWIAVALGVTAGLVVVGSSSGTTRHPLVLALVCVLVAASAGERPLQAAISSFMGHHRERLLLSLALIIGLVTATGLLWFVHREITKRVDFGSDVGRLHEWRWAIIAFHSSPVVGVGPDRLLGGANHFVYFAHNEYLQVLAGGGIVGFFLLALTIYVIRRELGGSSQRASAALAALLVFAICGFFDFTWHLPALGLLAGACLGLAFSTQDSDPSMAQDG